MQCGYRIFPGRRKLGGQFMIEALILGAQNQHFLYLCMEHTGSALNSAVVRKISKRHLLQDIKNSFHGVNQMGLKPQNSFFKLLFSTNMVARRVQSFYTLEGTTDPLIEQ